MTNHARAVCEHDHFVHFYESEAALSASVGDFLAGALLCDGAAIVVATAAHQRGFVEQLTGRGIDVNDPVVGARLAVRDASETLGTFRSQGELDERRFVATVTALMDGLAPGRGPVRVYGEMVALLWDEGDVVGAITLEGFWNNLARHRDFELLCAYPASSFRAPESAPAFQLICGQHSQVVPAIVPSRFFQPEQRCQPALAPELAAGGDAGPPRSPLDTGGPAENAASPALLPVGRPDSHGRLPYRRTGDGQFPAVLPRLTEALQSGDAFMATTIVRETVQRGHHSPVTVISRVIAPAMHLIGELWEAGAISIADEHIASAVCERVLAELYPALLTHRPRSRERILVAASEGEQHVLGTRAVADILEGHGFHVIYLGAGVPAATLGQAVRLQQPDLVALSLTRAAGRGRLDRCIAAVQEAKPDALLLLGGQGISEQWAELGFPVAGTTDELIKQVEDLLETRPAMPRLLAMGPARTVLAAHDDPAPPIAELAETFGRLARVHALNAHEYRLEALEDPLTRVPNRRAFEQAVHRAVDSGAEATLLVIDIDDFKRINDTFGHEAGDRVLAEVAQALAAELRPGDIVARIGGDEFGVVLTDTSELDVPAIADRLRIQIQTRLSASRVTVSIGGSLLTAGRATHALADGALYQAKARGRNQVVITGS